MKQPDIQHLIMQDLKFKMSAWRAIAIISLILSSGAVGLFISSEAELNATVNSSQDYCRK